MKVPVGSAWKSALWLCTIATAVTCHPERDSRVSPPVPPGPEPGAGMLVERLSDQVLTFQGGPRPPRRVGEVSSLPFPPPTRPPGGPGPVAAPELKVLRVQPTGQAGLPSAVTVSFNQPMVPLGSLPELAQLPHPLELQPMPKGRHRWLGTDTLAFEAEERLPFSTRYQGSVPVGTRSLAGRSLAAEHRWTFETPRLEVVRSLPSKWEIRALPSAVIAVEWNQKIDAKVLTAQARLEGPGAAGLELVPQADWAKLGKLAEELRRWSPGRVLVWRPRRPLWLGSVYRWVVPKGVVAGEGPLATAEDVGVSFRTHGPLRVESLRCGWSREVCRPDTLKILQLSNPIKTLDMSRMVRLTPAVPGLEVSCSGAYCYLRGQFQAQTEYRVDVDGAVEDSYEQRLGRPWHGGFYVGDARAELNLPVGGAFGVMERSGRRELVVECINVKGAALTLVDVAPEHVGLAMKVGGEHWQPKYWRHSMGNDVPGRKLTTDITLNKPSNVWERKAVSMDVGLGRGRGGILFVELHAPGLLESNPHAHPFRRMLVQVTELGLTVRYGLDQVLVLATGLGSGALEPGVEVKTYQQDGRLLEQATTGSDGIAVLKGPRALGRKGPLVVVARKGAEVAFAHLTGSGEQGWVTGYQPWSALPGRRVLRAHLFTERSPYRPGEKVYLSGILRMEGNEVGGRIEKGAFGGAKVRYRILDGRYQEVLKNKEAPVDPDGVFHVEYDIPEGAALGHWQLQGEVLGGGLPRTQSVSHGFQVLAYRAPEYKVEVRATGEPFFFGSDLIGEVRGEYFHGGPMEGAPVRWTLRRDVGSFRPPHHTELGFGELRDWAWSWQYQEGVRGGRYGGYYHRSGARGDIVGRGEGKLDARGLLPIRPKLERWPEGHEAGEVAVFTLEAEVFDKNRQAIAGRQLVTVHPAGLYLGLRMKQALVRAGQETEVQGVVTDLQGERIAGKKVELVATEQELARKAVKEDGVWVFQHSVKERVVGGCTLVTGKEVTGCALTLPKAGYYRIRGEITDDSGRRNRSVIAVYAVGKRFVPWRQENAGRLELVADRQEYEAGQEAAVLIKSPWERAVGLMTVERMGIRSHRVLAVESSLHVEKVRLGEADLPNVQVSVVLLRGRVKVPGVEADDDLGRPLYAVGSLPLRLSLGRKRLQVEVDPRPQVVRPAGRSMVQVRVRDWAGRGVRARLVAMAVDEGVLSLLGFKVPDPMTVFYSAKAGETALRELRADLLKQERRISLAGSATHRRRPAERTKILAGRGSVRFENRDGDADADGIPDVDDREETTVGRQVILTADTVSLPRLGKSGGRGPAPGPAFGSGLGLAFQTRALFATTACYQAAVLTDADGRATVPMKLPDNLTTYRLTLVALDRDQPDRFGIGESRLTVRRPLMLQPALPRFANFGDRLEAAVKVTNETAAGGEALVKVQVANGRVEGADTRTLRLDKGQTQEVRFTVSVGLPGRLRVQFRAHLGQETDAVELAIPVNLPATTEAFATYGVTEGSVAQAVRPPADALPAFGGLDLSFSSTALTGMEDAVRYLVDYPWECTEQTASRVLPLFALRGILPAFGLLGKKGEGEKYLVPLPEAFLREGAGASREVLERRYLEYLAKTGLSKLLSYQRYDGGFGYWSGATQSWPYPTVYALYALLRAREAGHAVPTNALDRAAQFLTSFLDQGWRWKAYPWQYALTARALATWVLSERQGSALLSIGLGRRAKLMAQVRELHGRRGELPLFAKALLLVARHRLEGGATRRLEGGATTHRSPETRELLRELDNAAVQDTPYKVHFREETTESLRLLMHSESRTDALVLLSLLEVEPGHPLVPKVVRGLLEARVGGRWESTQANAFALTAVSRYYREHEKVPPDFRLRAWLGQGYLGEAHFRGRSMKRVEQKVPMSLLAKTGPARLLLDRQGAGKLYYRLGLRYAPTSLTLRPEEQGFSVTREYEAVEGADTVQKLAGAGDRYRLKAGKYVRVRLRLVVPSQRYFVAVDDPLPAGLEAVDLSLKTSASSALAGAAPSRIYDFHSYYAFFAFSHTEKRDDRVVLFADRLPAGVYEHTYLARATSLGHFVVPPTKAEEMYHPEVFGRNGTVFVEVVE